jgi:metal transporter CNNM
MLLVKNLIGQDHDEQFTVSQLPLSPLPETNPKTSSLDILNFFREGTSKRKEEDKTIENDNCL